MMQKIALAFLLSFSTILPAKEFDAALQQIADSFEQEAYGRTFSSADSLLRFPDQLASASLEEQIQLYQYFFESLGHITSSGFSLSEGLLKMEDQKFEAFISLLRQKNDLDAVVQALNLLELYKSLVTKKRQASSKPVREWHYRKAWRKQLIQSFREATTETERQELLQEINALEEQIAELQNNIDRLEGSARSTSISKAQLEGLLKEDEALLSYFMGDSLLYCIAISKTEQKIVQLAPSSAVERWVERYRQNIRGNYRKEPFIAANYQLYQALIQPLEPLIQGKDQLVIIPDRALGLLSFENLNSQNPAPDSWDRSYQSLDFLIYHHMISYAHSVGDLLQKEKNETLVLANPKLLLLAPIYDQMMKRNLEADSVAAELPTLPNTGLFAQQIQGYFQGTFFTGASATADHLLEYLGQHDIVHLAAHTLVDEKAILNSTIALAPDSTAPRHLNYLPLAKALLEIDSLHTDLIVLSSCKTGSGTINKGEGLAGLAADFDLLGVPSLIYSFWAVDEKATCALFSLFYENLRQGKSKALALHEAKLELMQMNKGQYLAPFFWSGFVFLGEDSSYKNSDQGLLFRLVAWVIGLSISLFLLTVLWRRRVFYSML